MVVSRETGPAFAYQFALAYPGCLEYRPARVLRVLQIDALVEVPQHIGLVAPDGDGDGKLLCHDFPFYDGQDVIHPINSLAPQANPAPHTRRGDASTYRAPVRGSVYSPTCQPAFSSVAAQAR